ncbi:hypothetical protein MSAN_02380600 [Mycena sanguinolenta]|uniref:Uncharacterized protein n=1 Tax=Mycena sanguinolenta TaxID=230812 RepID=A0A8H6X4H7_9AGAR|nr:hypothetical protein MSAN_02380600 [Mycena sanguinolenta]
MSTGGIRIDEREVRPIPLVTNQIASDSSEILTNSFLTILPGPTLAHVGRERRKFALTTPAYWREIKSSRSLLSAMGILTRHWQLTKLQCIASKQRFPALQLKIWSRSYCCRCPRTVSQEPAKLTNFAGLAVLL